MNPHTSPNTFEELSQNAIPIREAVVIRAQGRRWCWITEWYSTLGVYKYGVKIEGQTTWLPCGVLQIGYGQKAHDWIAHLNEIEGISPEDHQSIWNSGSSSARAVLSDDETDVLLLLRGALLAEDNALRSDQARCVFTFEYDDALQIFRGLHTLHESYLLPNPSDEIQDVKIAVAEDSDVTFYVPGESEIDPHDEHCFTLTIDFQTAADLFALMPEEFGLDMMMLESPEGLLGEL